MWIRNAWYVAAWTHEIEPGRIHARTIIDQPLVLYRTADGGVVALEDRCPHRFAPLSLGRLEGDALRCMYHGLKFRRQVHRDPGPEADPAKRQRAAVPAAGRRQLGLGVDGRRRQG
jgi:phenylpropionate dioxygenase-like ring-hydroxylating dioxygenase large terminal subunit